MSVNHSKKPGLPLALFALIALNAAFLYWNAFRTFKFFDMGSHLDMAWRLALGQKPHVDFLSYTGPMHFYLNAFLFKLFGFSKTALWLHLVLVNSAVVGLIAGMLRKRTPVPVTVLCAALGMVAFYWTYSHPWYTQSAHFWGLAAVSVLAGFTPAPSGRRAFAVGAFAGAMTILSVFTKINVGLLYGALLFVYLLAAEKRAASLAGFALGLLGSLGALKIFFVPSLSAWFEQVWDFGLRYKGRALSVVESPSLWFRNFYWLAAVILALGLRKKIFTRKIILFLGLWFIGIVSTFSSGAVSESDVPVMGFYFALSFLILFEAAFERDRLIRLSAAALSTLAAMLTCVYVLYAVELKQWSVAEIMVLNNQTIDPRGDYELRSDGLRGWKTKKAQGEAVDGLVTFINAQIPKTDSLIVLTDLQILYPLTGRESYRGIPWIFTIDQSPAPGKQLGAFRTNFIATKPLWIVTHKARVAYITNLLGYLGIAEEIQTNYLLAAEFGNYAVLRRKS